MKKKKIHNLLIIDASGSMSNKVEEVRGGLNQLIKEFKEDKINDPDVRNRITMIDFSSHGDFNILYDNAKVKDLKKLKKGDYKPRSMTALFDAIGKSFALVPKENDAVLVTIFTDGLENDSKEFKNADVKKLITEKEAENWTVTFMGTTKEAMTQAQNMGITRDKMMFYRDNETGTIDAFKKMSKSRLIHKDATKLNLKPSDIFESL